MLKQALFEKYLIVGLNSDYFLTTLRRNKIDLYSVKKISANKLKITISFFDKRKFFAIIKKMCYNIVSEEDYFRKKYLATEKLVVRNGVNGALKPLFFLRKNIGVALGIVFFALILFFTQNLIFGIRIEGGNEIAEELKTTIYDSGVKLWTDKDGYDFSELQKSLKRKSERVSFASVYMRGNILVADVLLAPVPKQGEQEKQKIVSTVSGKIKKLVLYSGTALFKVGDEIRIGDELVQGFYTVGEEKRECAAKAEITLEIPFSFEYFAIDETRATLDAATALAKQKLPETIINNIFYEVKRCGCGVIIVVNGNYDYIIK